MNSFKDEIKIDFALLKSTLKKTFIKGEILLTISIFIASLITIPNFILRGFEFFIVIIFLIIMISIFIFGSLFFKYLNNIQSSQIMNISTLTYEIDKEKLHIFIENKEKEKQVFSFPLKDFQNGRIKKISNLRFDIREIPDEYPAFIKFQHGFMTRSGKALELNFKNSRVYLTPSQINEFFLKIHEELKILFKKEMIKSKFDKNNNLNYFEIIPSNK